MLLDHFMIFMFIIPLTMAMGTFDGYTTINNNIAKPNCQTACGNITVRYPFGIGTDCSLNRKFKLTCNTSFVTPRLFVGGLRIYDISDSELRVFTSLSYRCYNQSGLVNFTGGTDLAGFFTFSVKNKFTVVGCDDYALITDRNKDDGFSSGCFGLCRRARSVPKGECSGIGCCQMSIPKGLSSYDITMGSMKNHSGVMSFNECGYGFLVEEGRFEFGGVTDLSGDDRDFRLKIRSMTVVLDWVIESEGKCANKVNECKSKSSCYDVDGGRGYRCKCNEGYEGNPYLHPGCQGQSNSS
ncbi:hypothetical protein E3N88_01033 [Mikania micrantha]|uniref:EGF-like domain-containing protein n=1 Tax=Mikania micrantha TaxID=192012 RepID=A0A5N6Q198_9ASTR|nr:hypothetical protein E3N88_01033 [Mikania micrantha]